jgi:hypothetical protein
MKQYFFSAIIALSTYMPHYCMEQLGQENNAVTVKPASLLKISSFELYRLIASSTSVTPYQANSYNMFNVKNNDSENGLYTVKALIQRGLHSAR